MSKITLQTVIDALSHCDDIQEAGLLKCLNEGSDLTAGAKLAAIIAEYSEEEEEIEPDFQNPSVDAIHCDRLKG